MRGRRDFSRFDPRPGRPHFGKFGALFTVSGHAQTLSGRRNRTVARMFTAPSRKGDGCTTTWRMARAAAREVAPPSARTSRRRLWSLAPQQSPSGRCTSRAQPRPRVAPPSLAQYRRLDAVHMRQPHHRHHPRPLGAQKRARHVRVALGDERIVQRRYLGEMGVITRYD